MTILIREGKESNINMSQNKFLFALIILATLILSGCSMHINVPTKYDLTQLNDTIDKLTEIDQIKCDGLKNKRISTIFIQNVKTEYFCEEVTFPEQQIIKFKYDGEIASDIKNKLDDVLKRYCNATIVKNTENPDILINATIDRFYSQILDYKKEGDESSLGMFSSGETEKKFKRKSGSVLTARNSINNGEEWKYDHMLSLKKDFVSKVKKVYSGIFMQQDMVMTKTIKIDYDDEVTLATYIGAYSMAMGHAYPVVPGMDLGIKIDIYDINTMALKKQIRWTKETATIAEERLYLNTYFSAAGNLELLIYDYIKEIINKVNRKLAVNISK